MKIPPKSMVIACRIVGLCLATGGPLVSLRAQTPLPDDISIKAPSSAISREAAAFSGAWLGSWGGVLPTALVVERINSNGVARVIYSWGDSEIYGFKGGWMRRTRRFTNGVLRLSSKGGPRIEFSPEPDGLLFGRFELTNRPASFAELHRIASTNVAVIREAATKPVMPWKEIRIPVHSQVGPVKGKTFGLQTTIYPQASPGRHPVIIFNHGSTGPGIVPAQQVFRGGNEEIFFHKLGYIVVVPMRKGRGLSDGPNLEEDNSVSHPVQLDSAIEDLQAVVKYVRSRDDVDSGKIVVGGASRGGLLSVAYAGRYPTNVAGVINFSGGWFGEWAPAADFNFEVFGAAGHDAKVPMLWLYADHDSLYSLKFDEREFSRFRHAGGRGELVEVRDIPGDGHLLSWWVDRWRDQVAKYLIGL